MTVITISRQYGSDGDSIASRVCELLGYQAFNKNLIARAAQNAGLFEKEIIDYSEEHHKIRGFLDRLFGRSQVIASRSYWKEDAAGPRIVEEYTLTEDTAVALVEKAIRSAHKAGNLVIIGRGGQVILKDQPDVLHVRIIAPLEDRIQRVKQQMKPNMEEQYGSIQLRREVQDLIVEKDAASQDYLQHYYHVDWSDPLLYDIVLNTGKVSINQAAEMIVQLVNIISSEKNQGEHPFPAA